MTILLIALAGALAVVIARLVDTLRSEARREAQRRRNLDAILAELDDPPLVPMRRSRLPGMSSTTQVAIVERTSCRLRIPPKPMDFSDVNRQR